MNRLRYTADQRGFSLAEILVATAIFAIIMVAALMIYDQSQQVFKSGVESADTTQNVRVAFDKLVQDLRMAGFDFDRDGIPTGAAGVTWEADTAYSVGAMVNPTTANGLSYRVTIAGTSDAAEPAWPTTTGDTITDNTVTWTTLEGTNQYQQTDEQVEYIGPHAVVIRGNFDYETDPDNEHGRETDLESSVFPVVTTGNDEIVLYVLQSDDDSLNEDSVTFFADMSVPRDAYPDGGSEEEITVDGVDLSMENPPYTLYRITFDEDGEPQRSPLASNIRSLDITYYQDSAGLFPVKDLENADVSTGASILGAGAYDPANPTATVEERIVRARVRSFKVTLIGMNAVETPEYVDPYETVDAFKRYRKYRLESIVSPRNIGRRGMREQDTHEPGAPSITKICFGHCGIAYLEWQAPSDTAVTGAVEQYAVEYDTDTVGGYANIVQTGLSTSAYVYGLEPTTEYFFRVKAINSWGSATSAEIESGTPTNATRPTPPEDVTAEAGTNSIILRWTRPTANVGGEDTIACSNGDTPVVQMPAAELKEYRVWRSLVADFTPEDAGSIKVTGTTVSNSATGSVTFTDTSAASCVTYYYRVQTVDYCEDDAAKNEPDSVTGISDFYPPAGEDGIQGYTEATAAPAAVNDLQISDTYTCTVVDPVTCAVPLSWPKVTKDVDDAAIVVDKYIVRRQAMISGVDDGTPVDFIVEGVSQTADPTHTYTNEGVEKVDPIGGQPYTYKYTVLAVQCDVEGEPSPERLWPCTFAGGDLDLVVDPTPYDGSGRSGSPYQTTLPASVTVTATGTVQTIRMIVYDSGNNVVMDETQDGPFSSAAFTVDGVTDGEVYTLSFSITDEQGCTNYLTRYIEDSPQGCCLVPNSFDATVLTHSPGSFGSTVTLQNNCETNLVITSVKVKWDVTKLNDDSGPERIQTLVFNSAGTPVTFTFTNSVNTDATVTATYSGSTANATVAAGTSTYKMNITFNRTATSSAVVAVCVNYWRDKDGDGIVDLDESESCSVVVDDETATCP